MPNGKSDTPTTFVIWVVWIMGAVMRRIRVRFWGWRHLDGSWIGLFIPLNFALLIVNAYTFLWVSLPIKVLIIGGLIFDVLLPVVDYVRYRRRVYSVVEVNALAWLFLNSWRFAVGTTFLSVSHQDPLVIEGLGEMVGIANGIAFGVLVLAGVWKGLEVLF